MLNKKWKVRRPLWVVSDHRTYIGEANPASTALSIFISFHQLLLPALGRKKRVKKGETERRRKGH